MSETPIIDHSTTQSSSSQSQQLPENAAQRLPDETLELRLRDLKVLNAIKIYSHVIFLTPITILLSGFRHVIVNDYYINMLVFWFFYRVVLLGYQLKLRRIYTCASADPNMTVHDLPALLTSFKVGMEVIYAIGVLITSYSIYYDDDLASRESIFIRLLFLAHHICAYFFFSLPALALVFGCVGTIYRLISIPLRKVDPRVHFFLMKLRREIFNMKKFEDFHEEDLKCAICFVPYASGDLIIRMPCNKNHFYHRYCIEEWLFRSFTCPHCREKPKML
mmetsp:Transcript_56289/g.64253  ORF Transcript_56289/g.64253 Transcript_56289/m.64253 type:complete len:277 (+) Transcript_56289:40-870(+)